MAMNNTEKELINNSPLIIFTNGGGRLSKQLLNQAHLMAWVMEKNLGLVNIPFMSYRSDYPYFQNIPVYGFGESDRRLSCIFSIIQKIGSKLGIKGQRRYQKSLKYCHRIISKFKGDWLDIRTKDYNNKKFHHTSINLCSQEFNESIEGKKVILLSGWNIRGWDYLRKHQDRIRKMFEPCLELTSNSKQLLIEIRGKSDVVIGVFIRRGDYRTWMDGKYFFDISNYNNWMTQIQDQLQGKTVAFLISCEEKIPNNSFSNNVNVFYSSGSANKSGTATQAQYELSQCDYILTVPSTFSAWSSFMGNKPILPVVSSEQQININDIIPSIFQMNENSDFSILTK